MSFFKVNEETSNYGFVSLSPGVDILSCEPGRIPWRRMDIKTQFLKQAESLEGNTKRLAVQ